MTPISNSTNNFLITNTFTQPVDEKVTSAPTVTGLTSAGNVPMTKPEVKDKKSEISVTKGPGLDETLTNFYGKKYTKASEEEKEKLIVKYFDWLSKDKKDVISQLDQFKLYRSRCKNDAEYKRLSSVIDKMEAKYQLNAAKTVITEGTNKQKDIGQKAVADDYHHYDKSVQKDVSKLIVESKNEEAIEIGASHAAQTDKSNQVEIVKTFQSIDKIEVNKILIDQYGQYDKSNQIDIHRTMSASKHTETVEYAASNIWHFDKDNQAPSVKITTETGNEAAIKAAAEQYAKYDRSAQNEIKSIINSTDCDSAKEALEKAEQQAEQEEQLKAKQEAEKETGGAQDSQNGGKTFAAELKTLLSSNTTGKDGIKKLFERASESEKIAMLSSLSPSELVGVLGIIIQCNLPTSVWSKILLLLDKIDGSQKKDLLKQMEKTSAYGFIKSHMGVLGPSVQKLLIKESTQNNTFPSINKDLLAVSLKDEYNKLKEEKEEKEKRVA